MDAIRNFIHIVGITPENELPRNPAGQIAQYSDIETLHIPDDKPAAKSIFQIMLNVEVTSSRIVNTPLCRTMLIDGLKKIKIIYTEKGEKDNANFLVLDIPYNTFIEVPKECDEISNINVFILDAYFSLIDSRHIYSYILYLVHTEYIGKAAKKETKPNVSAGDFKDGFQLPQAVIEEMLISKSYSDNMPAVNEIRQPMNGLIDIDAEYL